MEKHTVSHLNVPEKGRSSHCDFVNVGKCPKLALPRGGFNPDCDNVTRQRWKAGFTAPYIVLFNGQFNGNWAWKAVGKISWLRSFEEGGGIEDAEGARGIFDEELTKLEVLEQRRARQMWWGINSGLFITFVAMYYLTYKFHRYPGVITSANYSIPHSNTMLNKAHYRLTDVMSASFSSSPWASFAEHRGQDHSPLFGPSVIGKMSECGEVASNVRDWP